MIETLHVVLEAKGNFAFRYNAIEMGRIDRWLQSRLLLVSSAKKTFDTLLL